MKLKCIILFLITFINISAQGLTEKDKFAYVNVKELYKKVEGFSDRQAKYDSLRKTVHKRIDNLRNLLHDKFLEITKEYNVSESEPYEDLKNRISKKDLKRLEILEEQRRLIEIEIESYNRVLTKLFDKEINSYVNIVDEIIINYCEENNIKILYKLDTLQENLIYYDRKLDITKDIVTIVNKKLRKKKE